MASVARLESTPWQKVRSALRLATDRQAGVALAVAAGVAAHACFRTAGEPGGTSSPPGSPPVAHPSTGAAVRPSIRPFDVGASLAGAEPTPVPPELAAGAPVKLEESWSYVLPIDHGVRADRAGDGYFRAPRTHGEHNGIDLLAPEGTPVLSPCEGRATSGQSLSFGIWVHVVCALPSEIRRKEPLFASWFFAHLSKTNQPERSFGEVGAGESIGAVGKTGNARGSLVQPHLHLELILHSSEEAAMAERHFGRDQSNVRAADAFFDSVSEECLKPNGLKPRSGKLRRARRVDPFLVLTCLGSNKPSYQRPPGPLDEASRRWSALYAAESFDVDAGPRAPLWLGG